MAEDQAPKPCPETMTKQTQERIDLYAALTPTGLPLPIQVDPALVNDAAQMDRELGELRMVVGQLRNSHAVGATGTKAEHLKEWLADVTQEEREDGRVEGLGD